MADREVGVDPIVSEARKRWARCDEAESSQRAAILAAKKFRAGDQWPEAIRLQRQGSQAIQGQAAQPPRPCLTIDRLSQPVRQISNTIKSASFAIDVLPNGHGADDDVADIYKGYLRRVQNLSRGESPIEWAADGAIEGGIGWFRILTEYVQTRWPDDQPPDASLFDQEVRLGRIANNLTVYCDPSANKPTRADAQFMFVTEDLSRDEFRSRFKKGAKDAAITEASLDAFVSTGDMPGWVSDESVRIAEYWRVTYQDETWVQLTSGVIVKGDAVPKDAVIAHRRTMRVPVVTCYIINAVEVLERYDWLGSHIPLIPILGEELNVDGKAVLRGVIQEGMDAQRMINYAYSGAIEIFALAPKSPFVAAAGQIDPYKGIWQTANIYNHAYLPYEPVAVGGEVLPPPQRQTAEAPIEAAVALMQKSEEAVKATTLLDDPSLGSYNPQEHSGRAIEALQARADLNASLYPSNVTRALIYAGELMIELIPKITRPGQLVQILGMDDEPEQVIVGQPFTEGPNGPQPSPPEVTPEIAALSKGLHKFYDLKAGRYAVTAVAGKAEATRREAGASALGELIPKLPPEMAAVATPDYVEQLSFPGAHQIAEKLRKALPPQLQQQEGDQPNVAQLQQQLQQAQQIHDLMAKELEAKTQVIQTDQIKVQAQLKETAMNNASAEKRTLIQATAQMLQTQAKLDAEDARTFVDAMENRLGKVLELHMQKLQAVHDAASQGRSDAHDMLMSNLEHQQTLQQNQQAHAQALQQGQQQQQNTLEQQAQQAALQPTPQEQAGA